MALISWDDEEQKKKDELFGTPQVKQVASIQSGSWQPAPSGADTAVATDDVTQGGVFGQQPKQAALAPAQENYLFSEEKAQTDQAKIQRDAEIEAAREQDAARQRAEAAAAVSEQFRQGEVKNQQGQKLNVDEIKKDQGWKKYYGETFKKEKDSLDFWGRLMDGGQASKRAETMARNKYNNELLLKAYDDNGNVLDANAAMQAKKLSAYNMALANDNSNRSQVLARAIGATKDNQGEGFWNRVKNAVNAEKQMSIYDAFAGADDGQTTSINDVGRFGGGLLQGFGTLIPIGLKEMEEAGRGRGTSTQTGFEEDLNAGERVGRGVSGALNVGTSFIGGSGKLLDSLTTKVMTNTATAAEKGMLKQLTAKILLPAVEQGAIGGAQAGAEYFGDGNTLLDENGEFDKEKLLDFSKQVGLSTAMGAGGGAVLAGAGMGINKYRGRNMPVLDAGQLAELETGTTNSGQMQLVNERLMDTPPDLSALDNVELPPVADGVAVPDAPVEVPPTGGLDPESQRAYAEAAQSAIPVVSDTANELLAAGGAVPAADGTAMPTNVTPVRDPVLDAPAADVTPVADPTGLPTTDVAPVADGTVQAPQVVPLRDENLPVVKSEQVNALKDARAGKSQAEEAAINQELQQIEGSTPRYKTQSLKESDLAENIHIQELDRSLQSIQQRRAQLIAEGRSENYSMVRNLDKAAEAIIKEQQDIANGVRTTSTVDGENTRLFGDKANAVGYTDGIRTEEGKRAVGVTQDGAGESSIIIDRNAKNAEAVFHHEAVHKTLNDFTTPEQRASVVDSYRNHHGIDEKMGNDQVEELLSDDFAKFVASKRNKDAAKATRGEVDLPTQVREFFEQAWQNIKSAYESMRANGTLTPEFQKLYNDLNDGKYANKSVINKAADPRIDNRYMVAGANAKNFDAGDKAGRNFTGIDKLTRFEIDDSTAKISDAFIDRVKASQKAGRGGGEPVRLGDVLDHDKLFDAYPDIADIKVSLFNEAPANGRIKYGGYTPSRDALTLNAHPRTASELRATILHEVQHAIQEREGFTGGLTKPQQRALGRGQPAGEKYFRSADEIESRLVESRRNMSQSERDATSFYDSIPADKPIGKTVIGNKDYETMPQVHTGTRIAEEMKAEGKKPTPNKNIIPEPFENNLPNDLQPNAPTRAYQPIPRKPRPTVSPEQKAINDFADRVFTNTDLHKDFKTRLARALGMSHDKELPIEELLAGSKLSNGEKAHITKKFGELEQVANEYNALMKAQRQGYKKGQIGGLNEDMSRRANSLIDKYGRIERDLNSRVRRIQGRKSLANRAANVAENLTGARNANILTSVGGIERNLTQELGVNILETILHPVRMTRNSVKAPMEIIRAYKRAGREFTNTPKTISEAFPYLLGNTYRLIMSPVTGVANVRKSVSREVLAESLLRAQGESPSRADIKRFAGAMGADSEVVANSMMGIMNGMTSHGKGLEVMRAYQDFIKTGSPAAKERFLANTESAANLAAKMTQVAAESDKPGIRIGVALMNTVFPFVNTATNLARTAVTYNLNPMARSINDETLRAVRSNPANVMSLLKAKGVNYGVMAGVYGLYEAGVIGYNDGEDVSKPNGVYIDRGNGKFFPVRGTPIELPIAAVVTAAEIAKHVAEGNPRPPAYYAAIMGKSLPYVDSTTNLLAAGASAADSYMKGDGTAGTSDNGYAAKAYGINLAKSFVPWSNNGVIPASNAIQGKSTNAKSVYDKDPGVWFKQAVQSAYDPAFRESLKDSRDMSGRVRTVDQQGGFTINKNINDANTATYNAPVLDLVRYGQKNGLGKGTQDMFNTYDTGKNNNFKSVQDSITFLDAPEVNGKTTPDNTKKLEPNEKLTDLSRQMRDGFYGETGSELLTLNGQELKSDASVPNKNGSKNSKLPLSMQSIKNAVAQTDLPKEEGDKLYAISNQSTELYNQLKAKSISYEQYSAAKMELSNQEVSILSASKNYAKMVNLFDHLDETGFFDEKGLGSTRSGQTYLWNSLNTLLGSKGATPAANYPEDTKGFTPFGRGGGTGRTSNSGGNLEGGKGIQWTPAGKRQLASVASGKYTPVSIRVKLGNEVKRDRTQNYSDRSF